MSATHVIEQLDFDIAFHCRDPLLEDGEELTALLKNVLLPVIDEVLDAYDKPGMVLRLETVELDLGAIPRSQFARGVGPRVRAALEDTLARMVAEGEAAPAALKGQALMPAARQTQSDAELTDLMQFLATGRLPWHVANSNARAHETLLDRLLEKGSEGLWSVLGHALGQRESARRLVTQYAEPLLLSVVRTRAPGHAEGVARMMARFRAMAKTRRFAGMSEARVMELCWKRVLQEFLAPAPEAIQLATLETHLTAEIDALSSPESLTELDQLTRFLATGRVATPNHGAQLERLIAAGGDRFWLVLAQAVRHPEQTARLVAHFAPSQLHALLRKRAPGLADSVHAMLDRLHARAGKGQFAHVDHATIQQLGWEHVLTQCLAQPAPMTDHHALERGIIARLNAGAAHGAIAADPEHLAQYLATGLPAGASSMCESILTRLVGSGDDAVWQVLSDAMRYPDRVHRLVTQFPESLLRAMLRKRLPGQADAVLGMLAAVRGAGSSRPATADIAAWACVLTRCLTYPYRSIDMLELERAVGSGRGAVPHTAERDRAPQTSMRHDLRDLVLFLSTGRFAQSSQGSGHAHEKQLLELLEHPGEALWSALANALSQPTQAGRLTTQYPDTVLLEIVQQRTPTQVGAVTQMLESLRARARAGGIPGVSEAQIAQMGWAVILAWCLAPHPLTANLRELERRLAALVPEPPATDMERMTRFIETGKATVPPAQALERLIAQAGEPLKKWLNDVLSRPSDVERIVRHFSERQLLALSRLITGPSALLKVAPKHGSPIDDDATLIAVDRFIGQGVWTQAPCESPAEAIVSLLAARTERLRPMLLRAIGTTAGARRILSVITEAQLLVMVRHFSPAQATQLTAVTEEWSRRVHAPAIRGMRTNWLQQRCWHKVLEASLLRTPHCDTILPQLALLVDPAVEAAAPARFALVTKGRAAIRPTRSQGPLSALLAKHHERGSSPLLATAGMTMAQCRDHVVAFIQADASISASHRKVLIDSIDSAAPRQGDARPFWQAVAHTLARGEPLDLEALAAFSPGPAAMQKALITGDFTGLHRLITTMLSTDPAQVARELYEFSRSPTNRAALASRLPVTLLRDLTMHAAPTATAFVEKVLAAPERFTQLLAADVKNALWAAVLPLCVVPGGPVTAAVFAQRLCEAAGNSAPLRVRAVSDALLHSTALRPMPIPAGAPRPVPVVPHRYSTMCFPTALNPHQSMALNNAGLVLAAPYLPRLLDMFGLVRTGAFVDADAAERAVHLMQFVVTGQASTPEYELTLNKLLCGLAPDAVIAPGIEISDHEQETIVGMLKAMIAAWKTLGGTSVAGLRQSFLARSGELQLQEDAWQLRVDQGPFDMLIDHIPWGFSIIKFGWMPQPVHVTWRP